MHAHKLTGSPITNKHTAGPDTLGEGQAPPSSSAACIQLRRHAGRGRAAVDACGPSTTLCSPCFPRACLPPGVRHSYQEQDTSRQASNDELSDQDAWRGKALERTGRAGAGCGAAWAQWWGWIEGRL